MTDKKQKENEKVIIGETITYGKKCVTGLKVGNSFDGAVICKIIDGGVYIVSSIPKCAEKAIIKEVKKVYEL